jgi:hypothetical protein
MSAGNQCCNRCFDFPIEGKENVEFFAKDGTIILVTYTKNGSVYMEISFDCGQTWLGPIKIMDLQGNLKEIKLLAKNKKFVVATIESIDNKDIARAVAGWIDPNKNKQGFTFRECTRQEGPKEGTGKIINISLGFRPYQKGNQDSTSEEDKEESCDTVFYMNEKGEICVQCNGHG